MTLKSLARWRVPAGFVFGAIVLWLAAPTPRSIAIGASIAAVGEAIRIWAAGHLNKAREVTASGPYRWLAHPLYVGSSILGVGLAIACGSVTVAALIGLYLAVMITAAVRTEEAFLRRAFGDRYDAYRNGRVDDRRFSVAQAIANREHRTVTGLVVSILLLLVKLTLR
jgi:protein-S-isoprenylcysteine O-methyltransferase Ste14